VVALTIAVIVSPDRSPLLENPLAGYIGKLSYSLYLWHWPLLVFMALAPDAAWTSPVSLVVLLLATSMISYHFVERPLRMTSWSDRRRSDLGYGLLAKLREEIGPGFHLVETVGQYFSPAPHMQTESRMVLLEEMKQRIAPGDIVFLGRIFLTREDPPRTLSDVAFSWPGDLENFIVDMQASKVTVMVADPPPLYQFPDIRAWDRETGLCCGIRRKDISPLISDVEDMLDTLAAQHGNLRVLTVFDRLCPASQKICTPTENRIFTMHDRDHLNLHGANLLKDDFLKATGMKPS